jgi:hypothetical protein
MKIDIRSYHGFQTISLLVATPLAIGQQLSLATLFATRTKIEIQG